MIAIVDYDAGNIRSVLNALKRVGASDYVLTASREQLRAASHVILPGVGEASTAMQNLCDAGLADFIPTLTQPVLGICVGAQLMCAGSEEGETRCMGIFPAEVRRFKETQAEKVPHMGWNSLGKLSSPLFKGLKEGEYVYFVHSYSAVNCEESLLAVTNYGTALTACVGKGNVFGCQFHPEKSGDVGLRILKAFCETEAMA